VPAARRRPLQSLTKIAIEDLMKWMLTSGPQARLLCSTLPRLESMAHPGGRQAMVAGDETARQGFLLGTFIAVFGLAELLAAHIW
jgi:hypothetical protein